MMLSALLPVAIVGYLVGTILAAAGTIRRSDAARGGAAAVFVVAWLVHAGELIQRWVVSGLFPISNLGEYLLMLAWAVMALHLAIWFGWKVHAAGLLLPPLVASACLVAVLVRSPTTAGPVEAPAGLFLFHVLASTLGMATLCVSLAMSMIFLFQDRALKKRSALRLLQRLPSLETCDRIGFAALIAGFTLLTIGIMTGLFVNASVHERIWVPGAKQILPLLAWIVFSGVLLARFHLGFRGRKSAYLTITGVTLGLLTAIGMSF